MEAPRAFELVRGPPSPRLAGVIAGMTGYRETARGDFRQRETAALVAPLIVSLGEPFLIALGREAGPADRRPSFVAGLHAGSVDIRSGGAAECVQVDLTPLGARRVFGGAVAELAGRIVATDDALGAAGRRLRERLAETGCWRRRFDLLEAFVARRVGPPASADVAFAYRRLAQTGGALGVAALAAEIGCSRQRLSRRFRAEIGLGPKAVARILRFRRACRLARSAGAGGWASVAAEGGYADQAHLVREFVALADEPPTAWARRTTLADGRLTRPDDDPAAG